MRARAVVAFLSAVLFLVAPGGPPPASPAAAAPMNDRFGIAHISYGNGQFSANRYRLALDAGVGWNRWVFYWHDVEPRANAFDFSKTDATVRADRAQGLKILGVLFGTPPWAIDETYRVTGLAGEPQAERGPDLPPAGSQPVGPQPAQDLPLPRVGQKGWLPEDKTRLQEARVQQYVNSVLPPRGLHLPVFADGTDSPSAGKAINQNNLWARYVQRTVLQYRGSVHAWEIWNEPDFMPSQRTGWFGFWAGGVDNYARLLKVAYLVVKSVDPSAPVLMGGMAFWHNPDFFPRLLQAITRDPIARQYGYYFDATAWHWYSRASQLYERTLWVQEELARQGITGKRVWITETNIPVCADSGVPVRVECSPGTHRGTVDHQASYIIQAAAYGFVAGVDKIFFFQLFDDELGPGEYYGLVRNNGAPRSAHTALRTATTYFNVFTQPYRTLSNAGRVEMMSFPGGSGQRLRTVWNTNPRGMTAELPMDGPSFSLVDPLGEAQNTNSAPGTTFRLSLVAANLNDNPTGPPDYIVGGRPYLVLERGVSSGNGVIEGAVRDVSGRAMGAVQVQVGDKRVATNQLGQYRAEVPPGLYDVSVATIIPLSDPSLSVPVWTGRVTPQNHALRRLFQNFLPINGFRGRPSR